MMHGGMTPKGISICGSVNAQRDTNPEYTGQRGGWKCSIRMPYKPQIDSFHMFRNPSRHRRQGAKRAVDLAGNVAGARVRAGERRSWVSPEQNQQHGQGPPGCPRGHLVGGAGAGHLCGTTRQGALTLGTSYSPASNYHAQFS